MQNPKLTMYNCYGFRKSRRVFRAGSFEIGQLFCYNMGFRAEFAEDEG
jgi:hypothetical protein